MKNCFESILMAQCLQFELVLRNTDLSIQLNFSDNLLIKKCITSVIIFIFKLSQTNVQKYTIKMYKNKI